MNNIPINIYNMLNYIDKGFYLDDKSRVKLNNLEDANNIYGKLFEIAYRNFELTNKVYIKKIETMAKPVGIVDISESFRTGSNIKGEFVCKRDELVYNILLLRIIKLAANILNTKYSLTDATQIRLILRQLGNVPNITQKEAIQSFNRLQNIEAHESAILALSKWIINSECIVIDEDKEFNRADEASSVITVQMHKLFEEFIRGYIKKRYGNNADVGSRIYKVTEEITELPEFKSDITIRWHNKLKASIIELKYYKSVLLRGKLRGSHLAQVMNYITQETKRDEYETTGVIIYGQAWDNNNIGIFRDYTEIGSNMNISYAVINLNAPFNEIKNMIDTIYSAEFNRD